MLRRLAMRCDVSLADHGATLAPSQHPELLPEDVPVLLPVSLVSLQYLLFVVAFVVSLVLAELLLVVEIILGVCPPYLVLIDAVVVADVIPFPPP